MNNYNEDNKNKFVSGMRCYKPHDKAPDFVKMNIVVYKDFTDWYKENKDEDGKVNMQLLKSKGGTYYLAKNEYKKDEQRNLETPDREV
jgi:hypothetical protein